MEPQRRELLAQCQQSLAQAMTEVETVLGLLEAAGALSPGERRQLDEEAGGAKAELLLQLLLAKEQDHFQDLRAALEKTQPHLLPILYLNGVVGPPQSAEGAGSTYSVLSIMPSDSESSSSLSSVGTTGKAPSPPPLLTEQQISDKVENLSIQLRLMTRERNELRKRLAFATHGATFDKRPYHRLNPDYERLKIQCVRAMSDLQSLQNQHTNALKRCEEVAKETDFYHTLHSRLLSDQTQLKDDVDMLRRENGKLLRERNLLQQSWEDMKRLREEDQKEIGDLRAQQQQEQQMKELEDLTIQLQSITYEHTELGELLDNCHYKDLNNRLNSLEMQEKEHKQVMLDLQKWPMEISDTLDKCKRLREENESYSLVQRDLTELENNVHMLRVEKRKMWEEQIALQESCEEVKKLLKELREKICDPCTEQHQEQESLDDRLKNLGKQKELVTQQRDLPEKLHDHVNVPEMRSENLQSELEQATVQDESLLPTELLQQED